MSGDYMRGFSRIVPADRQNEYGMLYGIDNRLDENT